MKKSRYEQFCEHMGGGYYISQSGVFHFHPYGPDVKQTMGLCCYKCERLNYRMFVKHAPFDLRKGLVEFRAAWPEYDGYPRG